MMYLRRSCGCLGKMDGFEFEDDFGVDARYDENYYGATSMEKNQQEAPLQHATSALKKHRKVWIREEWKDLMFRVSTAAGVATVFVIFAVFATALFYFVLYYFTMPSKMVVDLPIHFDYDPEDSGQFGVKHMIDAATIHGSEKVRRVMPSALVDLRYGKQQWERRNVEFDERLQDDLELLAPGFLYHIYVELRIPRELDDNKRNLGNIMVSTQLLSEKDKPVALSKRPVLLQDQILLFDRNGGRGGGGWWFFSSSSSPVGTTYVGEDLSTSIHVHMFELFQESFEPRERVYKAKVTLSSGLVQLFNARLKFHVQLQGIPYYMYHWKYTTFVLFMVVCSTVQIFSIYCCVGIFGVSSAVSIFNSDPSSRSRRSSPGPLGADRPRSRSRSRSRSRGRSRGRSRSHSHSRHQRRGSSRQQQQQQQQRAPYRRGRPTTRAF